MTNLPPSRTADKIMIRLPDGMRDRLQARASAKGNSVTAEVVSILSAALDLPNEKEMNELIAEQRRILRQKTRLKESIHELNERQGAILSTLKSMVAPDLLESTDPVTRGIAKKVVDALNKIPTD